MCCPLICTSDNGRASHSEHKELSSRILRASNEEKEDSPDKTYCVGKIKEKLIKLDDAETFSTLPFKRNDWILSVHWYVFVSKMNNRRGDRFYVHTRKGLLGGFLVDRVSVHRRILRPCDGRADIISSVMNSTNTLNSMAT